MDQNPFNRGMNVASDLVPVTPHNSNVLTVPGRAIRCRPDGTAGTVHFKTSGGQERTTAIAAGETIMVSVGLVYSTGTTATNLEVLI